MKRFFYRIHVILCILMTIIFIDSCKKIDEQQQTAIDKIQKDELAKLKSQLADHPEWQRVIFPMNIKTAMFFSDGDGNPLNNTGSASYTYQCMDISDMDFPPQATITSIEREYNCSSGYRFTVHYKVSVPLPLFNVSPINSQLSRGRIRIKNTSSTTIYSDLNIIAVTITDQGDDPSTGNVNKFYEVQYTTAWIPFTNFTPATGFIEHSIVLYTDCADAISVTSPYVSGSTYDATNPCQRIDPVAPNNAQVSGGTYTTYGTINGFGNMLFVGGCPYPPGSTYPDRQQIQLKCVASGVTDTWHDISPAQGTWPGNYLTDGHLATFNISTQAGTIGLYDSYYIPERDIKVGGVIQHGTYKVRNRNKMNSGCTGEWSPEYSYIF